MAGASKLGWGRLRKKGKKNHSEEEVRDKQDTCDEEEVTASPGVGCEKAVSSWRAWFQ